MQTKNFTVITVSAFIHAPVEKVWNYFSQPAHITKWYFASDDWHAPYADNDLKVNGKFKTTMAAKDGSMGFDFEGVYSNVIPEKLIEYQLADSRTVKVEFINRDNYTEIIETFDAENENSPEMQKAGWQSILDNFKRYVESN